MNRKKAITNISLMIVIISMMAPIALSESFAQSEQQPVWQLLYLKEDLCRNNDDQVADGYADLTTKYFELYELSNLGKEAYCITVSEYANYKETMEVDLVILVFDDIMGEKILQSNDLDGIYAHMGNERLTNHTIILCDCSTDKLSFESALTPWILSHELSHFVLSYKGYSKSNIQEIIHSIENEYSECVQVFHVDANCASVKITTRGDLTARDYIVMTPYKPAVGNSLINYISDDIGSNTIELQREITNLWVTGAIDDTAFVATLKHLVDPPIEKNFDDVAYFLEMENGFIISELVKKTETDWQEYLNPLEEETLQPLLDYIVPPSESQTELDEQDQFPHWFKTRALLWTEEKISDDVFFNGIEHLARSGTIQLS